MDAKIITDGILLIDLFNKREQAYIDATDKIADLLRSTVTLALFEFFETDDRGLKLVDFHLADNFLTITTIVTYFDGEQIPEIVERLAPMEPLPDGRRAVETRRIMRVGIPFSIAFADKDIILDYLYEATGKQPTPDKPIPTTELGAEEDEPPASIPITTNSYNDLNLTKEQRAQISLFEQVMKDIKQ